MTIFLTNFLDLSRRITNFGKLIIQFQVKSLSFSVDGMYVASVGEDRAVCIHRLANQKSLVELTENNWSTAQVTSLVYILTGFI